MLFAIIRKADGAFFPIVAGSNANSFIEFPDLNEPALLPPRTFTTIGAAKGTLTNWLKGPLIKVSLPPVAYGLMDFDFGVDDVSKYKHEHDPKRGTIEDYTVVKVELNIIKD